MDDKYIICNSLGMWANYIETGNVNKSGEDAKRFGEKTTPLTDDQMRFIIRLRTLRDKILAGKITCKEQTT